MTYTIRVGKNDPVFLDTEDSLKQVIDNVLNELYGEKINEDR